METIPMIDLTLNGQLRPCSAATIEALLQQLQLADNQVAIELNGTIIPREAFSTTPLQQGDRLEIVRFVGGG